MEKGLPQKLYMLYAACFPDNIRAEKTVREILAWPDNICLARVRQKQLPPKEWQTGGCPALRQPARRGRRESGQNRR